MLTHFAHLNGSRRCPEYGRREEMPSCAANRAERGSRPGISGLHMTLTRRTFTLSMFASTALGSGARAAIPDPLQVGALGLDLAAMDKSVAPGDDFYRYVSGTWLKTTQIPSDRSRWVEFNRLDDLNAQRNRSILEAAASARATPEEAKLGDFYASLMDEAGIAARGLAPLEPQLARIAA